MNVKLLMLLIGMGIQAHAIQIQKYEIEPHIKAILDEHSQEIAEKIESVHTTTQWHGVWEFPWLPGYYVKYGLERIKGVERIRKCIIKNHLDGITTPDKRIYHIKGRSSTISNLNYAVVIKAVESAKDKKPLSLEQVKQLGEIIRKADYVDMNHSNYIQMDDGRLCLIDTEGIFNPDQHIKGFLRMIGTGHDLNNHYTEEALVHLFSQVKEELIKRPSNSSFALPYLMKALKSQSKPYTWNYLEYATDYFKEFEGIS